MTELLLTIPIASTSDIASSRNELCALKLSYVCADHINADCNSLWGGLTKPEGV